jgi:hypothetical protein
VFDISSFFFTTAALFLSNFKDIISALDFERGVISTTLSSVSMLEASASSSSKKILENDQNKDPLPSTSTAPLIVQLPSIKKYNFRKTYRRSLMKAYRSNKELLHKKSTLEKKNKTLQKRTERLKKQQTVNLNKTSEEDDADASSMENNWVTGSFFLLKIRCYTMQ